MRKITIILTLLSFGVFGQQFPTVNDTIPPTGVFSTSIMIEGGFELIGISEDYNSFDLSNVERLYEDHLHRSVRFILYKGEPQIINDADSTYENNEFDIDIPPTEMPPPPVPNPFRKYRLGSSLRIVVDTSQIVSVPDYTDNSFVSLQEGETVKEMYESELTFLSKYYKPSTKLVEAYPLLIENISDSVANIETQEGWIYMIQEALDKQGNWRPVEYIDYRAVCGNSYGSSKLLPDEYLISKIYKYAGDFETQLRVKFATYKEVYYSNEFPGRINRSQFELPEYLITRTEHLNEHFLEN